MAESAHRFTYTEDPQTLAVRTLAVDGIRWVSPRDAALQAQTTADKAVERARADERERILAELEGPAQESEAMYAHAEAVAARLVEVICRLDRWKREALTVLAGWDEVHTALGSPGRLGESKAAAARAEATRLRAEVRRIARTMMTLPVLSWAHTDDCPGRPGMRGICACAMVPLVSRDAVLAAVAPTPAEWCEWAGWEGLL